MDGKNFWGLDLKVQIASDRGDTKPKVQSKLENAGSPNISEAIPGQTGLQANANVKPAPFGERSIAILNLPDTVPDVRIKPLVEPYGFKMIKLEPQHGGAIIEFTTVEGAGKAGFALEGQEFEGRKLRIGTARELNHQKSEWKAGNNFVQPSRVNRPTARGGGRGRGKVGLGRPAIPRATVTTNGEAKSNADFRAMLLKEPAKESEQDKDKMEE